MKLISFSEVDLVWYAPYQWQNNLKTHGYGLHCGSTLCWWNLFLSCPVLEGTKILPWPVHPFSVLTLTWFGDRKEILTCKKVHISSLQRGDIGTHLGPNLTWSYLWKNSPVKQKVSVVIPGPICLTQKIVHTASRCHIWKKYLNELSHLTFFVEIDRWGSVIFLFIDFVWCSVVHRVITDENRLMCTLFWTCRCTHMLHAHQVCGMMVVV